MRNGISLTDFNSFPLASLVAKMQRDAEAGVCLPRKRGENAMILKHFSAGCQGALPVIGVTKTAVCLE